MKRSLLALATLVALPLGAQAGDLSYNFLQGGYQYVNSNNGHNAHGWDASVSAAIGEHLRVFGGGGINDRDGAVHPSGEGWTIGGGFHTPVSAKTDFTGDVSYHRAQIDGVSGNARTWSGEVGVRSAMSPHVEGWLGAGYSNHQDEFGDIDRSKGSVFAKVGGQYKFDKNWGLVAEGRVANHNQSIFVGPRVSF